MLCVPSARHLFGTASLASSALSASAELLVQLVIALHYCVYAETNQIEDPRLKWREEQERMLKDYLADASQDFAVSLSM